MTGSDSYKVVTTGQILDGFDPAEVRERLVSSLRLKPEVAARFFEQPRVVKKGVSRANADKLCSQLAKLGIAADVQSSVPPVESPPVEPVAAWNQEPAATPSSLAIVDYDDQSKPKQETIECPSCHHVQAKSEQCDACGVWFHKFEPTAVALEPVTASNAVPGVVPVEQTTDSDSEAAALSGDSAEEGAFSPAALAAAAAVALFGAWLWKFVAVTFDYEFGLIAWGIGGAVGFAAAVSGSRGVQAGIVCGVLALGSIVLGKYWAYSEFVDGFQEAVSGAMVSDEEMNDYFEQDLADARAFVNGSGSDDFVRSFMVERGYTDTTDPSRVSTDDLEYFRDYVEPALLEMAQQSPDFEEWQANSMEAIAEISPWALMREGFGILDILFAFLGIGTAFRLASQQG
ncbi:MAG: hypothetical protein QNJ05_07390 [Woeseiaceae bacterium]|nr:hypothetical protein [Woeseiaceae bacterium]